MNYESPMVMEVGGAEQLVQGSLPIIDEFRGNTFFGSNLAQLEE